MAEIVGEIKSLKPSEIASLEKLSKRRTDFSEIVEKELAERAAECATFIGARIGLILSREGFIEWIVVGTKERLYLPDFGRIRVDSSRLRRLRPIVFLPAGQYDLSRKSSVNEKGEVFAPEIPSDLITDLEKLRLDCLAVVAVNERAVIEGVTFAYINAAQLEHGESFRVRPVTNYASSVDKFGIDFSQIVQSIEKQLRARIPTSREVVKNRAVLVGVCTGSLSEANYSIEELRELARSAGLDIASEVIQRRREVDPRTVLGKGKLEDLVLECLDLGAELLVFDRELSPSQLRSIANLTEIKVIDRSMLILDIFAQRAKSSEGRMQVELAQLKYSLPRLTEKDSGLSRLTGGIGGRGPGETKLEISRRRARDRIVDLEKRIENLAKQRGVRRSRRQSRGVPVISIVGYTNAGKSTLLNSLTRGDTIAESKMFSTLDPSSRRMRFPNDSEVIFVDTVGFIRELPKELVNAFRATLEEVGEADILIHLIDASNPEMARQLEVVEDTLSELGFSDKPRILVLNKVDLLSESQVKSLILNYQGIPVSAVKREGFKELLSELQIELSKTFKGQDPGRFTEYKTWEGF